MNRNLFAGFLALLPFLGMCFSVSLWDRIEPLIFGFPFNLFWLIAWIPMTSLCLWGAYRLLYANADRSDSEDLNR